MNEDMSICLWIKKSAYLYTYLHALTDTHIDIEWSLEGNPIECEIKKSLENQIFIFCKRSGIMKSRRMRKKKIVRKIKLTSFPRAQASSECKGFCYKKINQQKISEKHYFL